MAVDVHIVDLFGPVPDGMDLSEDNARHLDEGNLALIAIALLSVILRFGARLVQKAGFRADDYLVLVALVRALLLTLFFFFFSFFCFCDCVSQVFIVFFLSHRYGLLVLTSVSWRVAVCCCHVRIGRRE